MPGLYANDLSIDGFLDLAAGASWPEGSLICAFSPDQALFDVYSFDKAFLGETDSGRIFSPHGELKWRAMDGMIRAVYLGDAPPFQGLEDFTFELEDLVPEQDEMFLWGERTESEPEWIEQQVPHRFTYPIPGCRFSRGRIVLVIENWVDTAGLARFSRYHSIKEASGGNHATG